MSNMHTESDAPSTNSGGTSDAGTSGVKFVGWEPESEDVPRKHAPRLYHKKSRAGCQQCKARRVKCDEVHPVCKNCERHKSTCVWGRDSSAVVPLAEPQPLGSKPFEIRPKPKPSPAAPVIRESKERRLTEMYLLHHYQTSTATSLISKPDPKHHYSESVLLPRLAFKHNALLYAILATAALHLTYLEPEEPKHAESFQRYIGLSLHLHRDDVATLCKANADAAMCTSGNLRICTFAQLQERPMEPYEPPLEWLQMNYGTGHGLAVAAYKYLKDDPTSIMRAIIQRANVPGLNAENPQLRDQDVLYNEDNLRDLTYLLERTSDDELTEPWSHDVRVGYTTTVSFIGAVQHAIEAGEPEPTVLRRLLLFPTMVEKSFINSVEERRPRALVVLAHYFGLLARFRNFWWIGQAGPREVRAVQQIVEDEWQEMMEWPLKAIEEEATLQQPDPSFSYLDSQSSA